MARSIEDYATEFREQGYTIVPDILNREQIDAANQALEMLFEREKEIGPKRGWHTNVYKVVYDAPQKHPIFRSICFSARLLELMKALLGDNCVCGSLNGYTTQPGGETQRLHIDQPETFPGHVVYVNALHTLDPFTKENGATRVVPGSHNRTYRHKEMDWDSIERETVYLEAPAGSVIAFNGGVWHASSQNRTKGPRRALHPYFHKPWLQPQWDWSQSLSQDVIDSLTPEQRRLFGFNTRVRYYDYTKDEIVKPPADRAR